ncbi:type II toxin-antitoxin system VapB family antitoxin [Aurantimonas marianensis]|uniref:Type II toxin-antitoxin system VapB family antitoxin n=1 Tax=Aurantimonas marianensis TaxID=2920428 RepID=A0A9X2H7D0_9HYPH|nr:type II toxin-antitoxin system VapB family antitoxin [Aurantimonas marianensis]MCP3054708.1 type II toxin-antitoxin system VapB family antitoxin [Aurantimonas marianensis]
MPLYVKDREVGELADRLARLKKTSKTEAVRDALLSELARTPASQAEAAGADAETDAYVERALRLARELREKYPPQGEGLPVTKEWIDSLYECD